MMIIQDYYMLDNKFIAVCKVNQLCTINLEVKKLYMFSALDGVLGISYIDNFGNYRENIKVLAKMNPYILLKDYETCRL